MSQRSSPLLAAALLAFVGAIVVTGCGGGAAPAVAPSSKGADEASPEGALAALDRAERSLDTILGPRESSTLAKQAGDAQAAQPAAPEPPPPPPPTSAPAGGAAPPASGAVAAEKAAEAKPKKNASPPAAPTPGLLAADSCTTACTALASMTRAADHVCALAGAADARCSSARDRVKNAAARVHASCPVCG
jgi:hypothetical protein